ncbi:carbohydrate binding domain-containing protein [Alkalihalobacillus macyae]|uniref:carbohydrate binding domain-containing protein n=1 Tax=Guptibacillus hwajinpoensis TaxID=208199 RepID=UPI00273BF05F|nr:carbohydrate binding domain-containing protein [Alkalihalobacillus macyae]MDP4552182.1 carbohydrate binding domain-containing protein [Alkalihalobacillus macyae]
MRSVIPVLLAGVLALSPAIPTAAASHDKGKEKNDREQVIAQPFHPAVMKGKVHGTTKVRASVQDDLHLAVKISNEAIQAKVGEDVPGDRTVTNPYVSGADLSGVDEEINKFVMVYVLDKDDEIVDFKQIELKKSDIQKEEWNLVWEDEFNGESINEDKWNFVQGGGGYGNNEWQNYTNREKNARVEDGSLVIEAHKEDFGGNDYTSAKLTTQNKGDWTYGRYEIKAKLPKGQGMWPAIWMMPTDYELYSGWPATGEIDIMELLGHDPDTVHGTLHYGKPWKNTGESYDLPVGDFSDEFHTFTLDWEPGEFRWYVDGILYAKQNDWFTKNENEAAAYTYPAPFDRNFFLQLNLAVGGNWPGYPDESTNFPNQMLVDYVKVYELDGDYREAGERPVTQETDEDLRDPIEGDYVYNGQFNTNLEYWDFQPFEPSDLFGGIGEVAVVDGEANVTITDPGDQPYAIQFVQPNIPLENGERYRLSFDARSSNDRGMVVNVSGPEQGFARYLSDKSVALSSNYESYSYEFEMENGTDPHSRIEFNMGQSSGLPVWIDNVSLVKLPKDPNASKKVLPNGNYIYNGTFDQGSDRMVFWELDQVGKAKATTSVGEAIPDREMTIDIKKSSKEGDVRLSQDNLNVEEGVYVLTFDAKADDARSIGLRMTNHARAKDYVKENISITDEMSSYQVLIDMNETDSKTVFEFLLGGSKRSTVTIDNVEMKRVAPPVTIEGFTKVEAEDFQSMSGVQVGEDGKSVGWIDDGDWMQYAVDVKEAGTYTVRYQVASGRDGGNITLLRKSGNVFDGTLGMGEIPDDQADEVTSLAVEQTGGWGNWETVTDTIYLDKGIQTLQVNAANVNLDWIAFAPEQTENDSVVRNGDFSNALTNWGSWWGDQWSGAAEGEVVMEDGQMKLVVTKTGDQSYSPQVFQENLLIENGRTYTVSFDAKSSVARDINLVIGEPLSQDPWFIPFMGTKQISIGTEMETHTFTFEMQKATNVNGKLVFEVGKVNGASVPSTITLDNVAIR